MAPSLSILRRIIKRTLILDLLFESSGATTLALSATAAARVSAVRLGQVRGCQEQGHSRSLLLPFSVASGFRKALPGPRVEVVCCGFVSCGANFEDALSGHEQYCAKYEFDGVGLVIDVLEV